MITIAKKIAGTTLLTLSLCANVNALELTHAGATIDVSYGRALQDNEALESALKLQVESQWSLASALDLIVSARARFDSENRYIDPQDSFTSYAHVGRPVRIGRVGYAELDDAYLELSLEHSQFRLGKQQIVWGALDGLKVTDVLNPQRFREFILEPFDKSRIATFSAYGDITVGETRVELAWLPDETTHDLAEEGDWFAFRAQRFALGVPPEQQTPGVIQVGNPNPELARGAVRITRSFGGTSASVIAAHTLDYEPTAQIVQLADGPQIVQRNYHSLSLYGLTLESAIGPFAFRAEAAYRPNRHFNLRGPTGLSTQRLNQWSAAIAADIDGPWNTFINIQLLFDQVLNGTQSTADPEAGPELVRPRTDRLLTAFVRRQFLYDTLTVDLRWYGDLDVRDGLYRAEISYSLGDNTRLAVNVDSFYAGKNSTARAQGVGLFGQFSKRDRASITLTYTL